MKVQTEALAIEASGSLTTGAGATISLGDDSQLLIPKFATADIPVAAAGNKGMLVYDETTDVLKISTGAAWLTITTMA